MELLRWCSGPFAHSRKAIGRNPIPQYVKRTQVTDSTFSYAALLIFTIMLARWCICVLRWAKTPGRTSGIGSVMLRTIWGPSTGHLQPLRDADAPLRMTIGKERRVI